VGGLASFISGVQMDYEVTGRKKYEEYGREVRIMDNQGYGMKAGQNLLLVSHISKQLN
jgi:hypothetical protein